MYYSPCNRQSATRRSRPRRARRRPRTLARPRTCSTARARGTSPPSEATTAGPGTAAWDPPCPCPCQGPPALLPARPLPTPGARRPRPAAPPRRRAARLPGHPSGPPAPRPSPATPSRRRPQRGCRRGCVTRVGATLRCSGSGGGGGGSLGGARHGRGQSNSSEGHGRASPGGPLLDRKARSRSSTPPRGVRPDRAGAHRLDAVVEVGFDRTRTGPCRRGRGRTGLCRRRSGLPPAPGSRWTPRPRAVLGRGSPDTRRPGDPGAFPEGEQRGRVRRASGGRGGGVGGRHGFRGASGGVPARGLGFSSDLCPPRAPLAPCVTTLQGKHSKAPGGAQEKEELGRELRELQKCEAPWRCRQSRRSSRASDCPSLPAHLDRPPGEVARHGEHSTC